MLSRLLTYLSSLLLLLGCGKGGERREVTGSTQALQERYDEYLQLGRYGWDAVPSTDCDALLFAALSAVAHDREFNIEDARSESGQWFRLPIDRFAEARCSSTISRDMLLGVLAYSLHFKRLDIIEALGEYGRANGWKMGTDTKPLDNRTSFTPATISLLYRIEHHLGGKDRIGRHFAIPTPTTAGYQSHLGMLQLWMMGRMEGRLDAEDRGDLEAILQHSSLNPLAWALKGAFTDGDQSKATELLLRFWPAGRLPTTEDWRDVWRTQRDDKSNGLLPADDGRGVHVHSGGDFLFAAGIVLGKI